MLHYLHISITNFHHLDEEEEKKKSYRLLSPGFWSSFLQNTDLPQKSLFSMETQRRTISHLTPYLQLLLPFYQILYWTAQIY